MLKKKSIDEVYAMCDSRYELVNVVAAKAREISDDAEENRDILIEKPVNIVLRNLMNGTSTIVHGSASASVYSDKGFELTISADHSDDAELADGSEN